jgi:hypothetical protein
MSEWWGINMLNTNKIMMYNQQQKISELIRKKGLSTFSTSEVMKQIHVVVTSFKCLSFIRIEDKVEFSEMEKFIFRNEDERHA